MNEALFFLQADADQRAANEEVLVSHVRDYIMQSHRYKYGGVVNALAIIADVCEQRSAHDCDDWAIAARKIDAFAHQADLRYREGVTLERMFEENER